MLSAFANGDVMLNVNAPGTWNGEWATTRLGVRWYRNAVHFGDTTEGSTATFTIGAASVDHAAVPSGDCDAVEEGKASLSCLAVWPRAIRLPWTKTCSPTASNALWTDGHAGWSTVDGHPHRARSERWPRPCGPAAIASPTNAEARQPPRGPEGLVVAEDEVHRGFVRCAAAEGRFPTTASVHRRRGPRWGRRSSSRSVRRRSPPLWVMPAVMGCQ